MQDNLIGQIIGGRYRVDRVIGRGGMGTIYEVSHQVLGRKFAMKTLSSHLLGDEEAAQRFFHEADSVAKLRHPNVVDIFGWEHLADGSPCIVMEFLEGEDLGSRLRREGALSWSAIARISDSVLSALSVAHSAGIVHRDLKPPNIFLARGGDKSEQAKLLDFGLSKIHEGRGFATSEGRVLGTPAYMAPEQANPKNGVIGPHTDLWAMGAILFEMATGQLPFPGIAPLQVLYRVCYLEPEPLLENRRDAPPAFVELVDRALTRDIAARIGTAREFRELLREALSGAVAASSATSSGSMPHLRRGADGTGTAVPLSSSDASSSNTVRRSAPPTGTITFLFTEIVDCVRLWEEHPEAMKEAISRHDALMHEAMTFYNGYVFRATGDTCQAAFSDAGQAVQAGLAALRMLERAPFGEIERLGVRIALHTGPAHERDGEYFGPTLNRIARILALGSGGQILLSGATRELVREFLPEQSGLQDRGIQPLRDLTRPEHVYQLTHPDLKAELNSLLTVPRARNNLPHTLSTFVGRKQELSELEQQLRKHRLVTISGLGGSGKTRLALQTANDMLGAFPDGVWLVELAALTDGVLVAQTVAKTLGLVVEQMFSAPEPWLDRLAQHLKDEQLLLVLDNCEHVISSCAELAGTLLARCGKLRILATSREPLAIDGEVCHRLAPLSTPEATNLERAGEVDAVQLFVERARLQKRDFALTQENLEAVCQICRELEGIPLAIELAAARVGVLPIESLASRLRDRFALLRSSGQRAAPRQRSLRATLDWSYELLSHSEQRLLARLSVFRGSFPLNAIEEICSGSGVDAEEVLDLMTQLSQRSLVRVAPGEGEPRYKLLDTVREYATAKLTEAGEVRALHIRHRDWYIALAEKIEPELRGKNQTVFVDQLEAESDNVRAALRWTFDHDGGIGSLRLCGALWWFWFIRGHMSEGRRHLEEALANETTASDRVRAKAMSGCGLLTVVTAPAAARQILDQALELASRENDPSIMALACCGLGWQALFGDMADMQRWLSESRRLYVNQGDQWGRGMASLFLGMAVDALGNRSGGESINREAVEAFETCGDRIGLALALINSGEIPRGHGDYQRAASFYERGLALCREAGNQVGTVIALTNLGMVESSMGDEKRAEFRLRESLSLSQQFGLLICVPVCLLGLSGVSTARGDLVRGARLLGASLSTQEAIGGHFHPADQLYFEQTFEVLRQRLDVEARLEHIKSGESLTLADAISLGHERVQPGAF